MFKKITRSTLTALGLIPMALFSDEIRAEQSNNVFGSTRVVAELQVGQKLGGSVDLLVPLHGDASHLWYGDLQAYGYDAMYRTYGIGGGHRQVINDAIYGFYGFFDRQISANKIYYNRYNAGVERLGETWDIRANLYLYANTKSTNIVDQGQVNAFVSGNNILYTHLYDIERVYNGGDIEVGRTLGLNNLRGYLGYYNFGNEIKGPKARIEYQVNPRVALSASTQTDTRGWLTYAGVSYWFGKTTLPNSAGISSRMLDPVVRDMTVAAKVTNSYAEYDLDARNIYFAQPSGASMNSVVGVSAENGPTIYSLQDAIAASKENDIIYLVGGTQPYDITNGIALKSGQTLLSSTQDLSVNGFLIKQATPTNNVQFINGGITVADGAILNGFSLDGTGIAETQNGITINGTSAVTISNVSVTGFAHDASSSGIAVLGAAPVTLTNITSDANGVGLTASAGQITINGTSNSFQNNTQGGGIVIEGTAALETLSNANTSGNVGDGILLNSSNLTDTVTLNNITSSSSVTGNGIWIKQAGTVNFTGTTITSNNSSAGLRVNNPDVTVTIANITSDDNTLYGLRIQNGTVSTLDDRINSFSGNQSTGVYISGDDSTLLLKNATIASNVDYGVRVTDGKVDINHSTISDTTSVDGLSVDSTPGNQAVVNVYSTSIYNNKRNGILAIGVNGENATVVTVDDSSIYDNLDNAIEVSYSAQVIVNSPLKLIGTIRRANDSGTASITINDIVEINSSNQVKQCDIGQSTAGTGSCT
jgi:Inverse autotransporter, beta-domain